MSCSVSNLLNKFCFPFLCFVLSLPPFLAPLFCCCFPSSCPCTSIIRLLPSSLMLLPFYLPEEQASPYQLQTQPFLPLEWAAPCSFSLRCRHTKKKKKQQNSKEAVHIFLTQYFRDWSRIWLCCSVKRGKYLSRWGIRNF